MLIQLENLIGIITERLSYNIQKCRGNDDTHHISAFYFTYAIDKNLHLENTILNYRFYLHPISTISFHHDVLVYILIVFFSFLICSKIHPPRTFKFSHYTATHLISYRPQPLSFMMSLVYTYIVKIVCPYLEVIENFKFKE